MKLNPVGFSGTFSRVGHSKEAIQQVAGEMAKANFSNVVIEEVSNGRETGVVATFVARDKRWEKKADSAFATYLATLNKGFRYKGPSWNAHLKSWGL